MKITTIPSSESPEQGNNVIIEVSGFVLKPHEITDLGTELETRVTELKRLESRKLILNIFSLAPPKPEHSDGVLKELIKARNLCLEHGIRFSIIHSDQVVIIDHVNDLTGVELISERRRL